MPHSIKKNYTNGTTIKLIYLFYYNAFLLKIPLFSILLLKNYLFQLKC